ncbi:hypothetical protein PHMEG_00014917 [Phytophthora megakarya]|uniref:Uncharacterized protein n=1 Tax=Phytophthora megakarya TaxID=4795 RepID=A0A225W2M7_9STRA|nr:hypothetical protein PHMEG_00014917 [Phytophthora megakarya]
MPPPALHRSRPRAASPDFTPSPGSNSDTPSSSSSVDSWALQGNENDVDCGENPLVVETQLAVFTSGADHETIRAGAGEETCAAENLSAAAEPGEENQSAPKLRQRFGENEDYLLAVQVNANLPFKALHGGIRKAWQKVADKLNDNANFRMRSIKGTTAQARFDALLQKHREWEKTSKGLSGIPEEHTQMIKVMTNLERLVNDHKATKDKVAAEAASVERSKVQAGDVVREAAVSRISLGKRNADDEDDQDGSSTSANASKRRGLRKNNVVSSMFASLSEERSKAMGDLIQLQQDQLKQRQAELEFEREHREKEREERKQEREVQQSSSSESIEKKNAKNANKNAKFSRLSLVA